MSSNVDPGPPEATPQEGSEQLRPVVTRREFIAGAGAGVAVGAVVAGGIAVATRPTVQTQPGAVVTSPGGRAVVAPAAPVAAPAAAPPAAPGQQAVQPAEAAQPAHAAALPLSMRRVDLNIDGVARSVTIDVRESLWEAMVYRLSRRARTWAATAPSVAPARC
jgi:hypothetical protein